jgi:hypothetical protein
MLSSTRSRWWLPGGGSHHPFLYRRPEVIDLTAVDELVGALREVIDLTAETEPAEVVNARRVVDPFALARRSR